MASPFTRYDAPWFVQQVKFASQFKADWLPIFRKPIAGLVDRKLEKVINHWRKFVLPPGQY
jgi:hypothetical protein